MNYSIDGKKKIESFITSLKLLDQPYLIANDQGIQFIEMPETQQFNQINKSDYAASLVDFKSEFFSDIQLSTREIHLQYMDNNCLNIAVQQQVCQLNGELRQIACLVPAQNFYKAFRPIMGQQIKTLNITLCYLISNSNRNIQLKITLTAQLEAGLFILTKPINMYDKQQIQCVLDKKLLQFSWESCIQIKESIGNYGFSLACRNEEVVLNPFFDETKQLSFASTQLKYYNESLIEDRYSELMVRQIHNKTFNPIIKFCSKMKLDLQIYLKENQTMTINLYFVVQTQYYQMISRQSAQIYTQSDVCAPLFEINENILEEIESQHSLHLKQLQKSENSVFQMQQSPIRILQLESQSQFSNKVVKYSTDQLKDNQQSIFIPPKITGSINQTILEILQKGKQQTMNTLKQ